MVKDEALVWRLIQQKDESAFEAYYKENYQACCLTAYRYLRDRATARQVVNDVFLVLWTQAASIRIETSLRAYIYRAIVNRSLNLLKKERRQTHRLVELIDLPDPTAGTRRMEQTELNARLMKAIDELPEQCGKVFRMSRFQNMKRQEIADKLGISVKTVQHHIARALADLHRIWDTYSVVWLLLLIELFLKER